MSSALLGETQCAVPYRRTPTRVWRAGRNLCMYGLVELRRCFPPFTSETIMDLYHVTLFIHILTLVAAAAATAVTKLAVGRRATARTVGEALDWHNVLMSASKAFPLCLLAFMITGGYMLSVTHLPWSTGFVVAGLLGVGSLLASGVFLATKGKALKQVLEDVAKNGADLPAPKLVPPPLVAALPVINTGIALSVAFDMVTKPTSVVVALGVIGVGVVVTGAFAVRRSAPAVERVRTA
jgi:hypothetical protein